MSIRLNPFAWALCWLDQRIDARIRFASQVSSARIGLMYRSDQPEFRRQFLGASPEVRAAAEAAYLAEGNPPLDRAA